MNNSVRQPSKAPVIPILLILVGAFGLFYYWVEPGSNRGDSGGIKQDAVGQKKVNDHLISTAAKIALDQEKANLMVREIQNNAYDSRAQQEYQNSEHLDLSPDPASSQVHGIVRNRRNQSDQLQDPNELIQSKIFDDEQAEEMSEEYKRQYAKQYVENARKDGWDITLDKDFKVIKVSPIRK